MTWQAVSSENRGVRASMDPSKKKNKGHLSSAEFSHTKCSTELTPVSEIRHGKPECCPDWASYIHPRATLRTTDELWVAALKCFPWMALTGATAASAAGIPVPVFAAWLASKYILTSVSFTRQFATISTVTAEMTAGSDRPGSNPLLAVAIRHCTDYQRHTATHTHIHKVWSYELAKGPFGKQFKNSTPRP